MNVTPRHGIKTGAFIEAQCNRVVILEVFPSVVESRVAVSRRLLGGAARPVTRARARRPTRSISARSRGGAGFPTATR